MALRTYLWQVVLFLAFALWIPAQKGIEFLDSIVLGVYASLGAILAAPAAASGTPVLRATAVALGVSWAATIAGVLTVYATHHVVVGPDLRSLGECALFGAGLTWATASVMAWLARRTSTATAKIAARVLLLALLGLLYLYPRTLPDVALFGAAICAGIGGSFWWLGRRG